MMIMRGFILMEMKKLNDDKQKKSICTKELYDKIAEINIPND